MTDREGGQVMRDIFTQFLGMLVFKEVYFAI